MNGKAVTITAAAALWLWQCPGAQSFFVGRMAGGPRREPQGSTTTTGLWGGYEMFADPTCAWDKSQTHMIFGTRCREVPTELPDGRHLVGLLPTATDHDNPPFYNYGQALVNCVSQQPDLLMGATVIEIGDSTFSLAARALGALQVAVCHLDESRLRQVEYAHAFLNDEVLSRNTGRLSTKLLRPGEPLPNLEIPARPSTTIVVFTMGDNEAGASFSCWDRMAEAFQVWNPQYMLIPSPLVPESQLSNVQAQYPEVCGIFVVSS